MPTWLKDEFGNVTGYQGPSGYVMDPETAMWLGKSPPMQDDPGLAPPQEAFPPAEWGAPAPEPLVAEAAPLEEMPGQGPAQLEAPLVEPAPPGLPLKSVTVTRSETSKSTKEKPQPMNVGGYDALAGEMKETEQAGVEATQQEAALQGHLDEAEARAKAEAAAGQVAAEDLAISETEAHEQRYQRELADIEEAEKAIPNVDPGRMWSSMSEGRKAAAIVSLAIGGFLEGFSNGRIQNKPLQIFMNRIDQDLEQQNRDIDRARSAIELQKNSLYKEWERTGDRQKAIQNHRLQKLGAMVNQATAEANQLVAGSIAHTKAQKAVAELKQGYQKERLQVLNSRVTAEATKDSSRRGWAALNQSERHFQVTMRRQDEEREAAGRAAADKAYNEGVIVDSNSGQDIGVATKGTAEQRLAAQNGITAAYKVNDRVQKLLTWDQTEGTKLPLEGRVSGRARAIESVEADLVNSIAVAISGGGRAMSDADVLRAEKMAAKFKTMFTADPKEAWSVLLDGMGEDSNKLVRNVGINHFDIRKNFRSLKASSGDDPPGFREGTPGGATRDYVPPEEFPHNKEKARIEKRSSGQKIRER